MIRIRKSSLPADTVIRDERDWIPGTPVYARLTEDCHGKCYICEDNSSDLNVEHIKPLSKYPSPAFALSWDNLLLACKEHCNPLKGNSFAGIINPCVVDPEAKIGLSTGLGRIVIERLDCDTDTRETAELLEKVYNATGLNANWRTKCRKLRGKIETNVKMFLAYAENAGDDTYDELIRQEIDNSAAFAAFKRKIVRDDPQLCSRFSATLAR
ncbi:MAG: hypothetical protein LBK98_08200 [Peptococcaceae bacterium]|jgi:hypothetical protein|nr:hypothetical protein [Peptococcaceae bacterium]